MAKLTYCEFLEEIQKIYKKNKQLDLKAAQLDASGFSDTRSLGSIILEADALILDLRLLVFQVQNALSNDNEQSLILHNAAGILEELSFLKAMMESMFDEAVSSADQSLAAAVAQIRQDSGE